MSDWFLQKIKLVVLLAATAIFAALVVLSANLEIRDLDIWLHIAAGKYILQTLSFPAVDIFSCSIAGRPWINHEWLFQIIVGSTYQNFGAQGLITITVLLVGLIFFHLWLFGHKHKAYFLSLVTLLLVLSVYQARIMLRPDMFSSLFVSLYVIILTLLIKSRSSLWLLVGLQLIWTNMHGFFVWGPGIVFVFWAGEWARRHLRLPFQWAEPGKIDDESYRRLKQILIASVLVCFLNPYTFKGVWYPLNIMFSLGSEHKIFFQHIYELKPPITWGSLFSLDDVTDYKILIFLSAASFLINFRRIDVRFLALWVVFLVFSLGAIRNISLFAIIAYFVIVVNLQRINWWELVNPNWDTPKRRLMISTLLMLSVTVWMAKDFDARLLRGYFNFDLNERKSEYGGVSLRNFPTKAADFLIANNIRGNFFNDFNSGAYLIGRVSPSIKVFIDGRTELYGQKMFKRYHRIWLGDYRLFKKYADDLNLTGVFLNSVFAPVPQKLIAQIYQDDNWKLVYFDYDAAIFLKNITANKRIIDQYAIDLKNLQVKKADLFAIGARPVIPYRYMNRAKALFNLGFYDQAKEEAQAALDIAPNYIEPFKVLGRIALVNRDYLGGFANFRKAATLNSNDHEAKYYLADSLLNLGRVKEAEVMDEKILKADPQNIRVLYHLALIKAHQQSEREAFQLVKAGLSYDIDLEFAEEFQRVKDYFAQQGKAEIAVKLSDMGKIYENTAGQEN